MATKRWVVNAWPLILLGKTDALDLHFGFADSTVIPQSVTVEIGANTDGTLILDALKKNAQCSIVENVMA
jgi:hypothetical protein